MIFSKRNSQRPDTYRYDIPQDVRLRVLHTFRQIAEAIPSHSSLPSILQEVGEKLLQQYGRLDASMYRAASSGDPIVDHFLLCNEEKALDFIELCFQAWSYRGGNDGVVAINKVFQEESIGYELTPMREIVTGEDARLFGRRTGGKLIKYEYPHVIKKEDQFVHQEIVRPCLEVLSNPIFQTANSEMLKSYEDYRKAKYADAITSCGSAFESVLKTICSHHKWAYDPDKDTCSKLVAICKDNGLFPPFYAPIFEATGTIRNKLGDAHGRGPAPMYTVGKEHVEHLIHTTAAHILLLVTLAKL